MRFKLALMLVLLSPLLLARVQVRLRTAEDRLFEQIAAEVNGNEKRTLFHDC